MSLTFVISALLLAAASPGAKACMPDPPGALLQSEAEAYITSAEMEWAASVATGEAAYLRRVVADDFRGVLEGKIVDRATLIAEAEKRRAGAASDVLEQLRVHLSGAIAVAEGVELWTDRAPRGRTRLVWSDIWVHCDGAWRLVISTSVGTPAS